MRKPNRWYVAVREQFTHCQRGTALTPSQIWEGMEALDFQHASKMPRSTLGARLAEMVEIGMLERVGPSSYRLPELATMEVVA